MMSETNENDQLKNTQIKIKQYFPWLSILFSLVYISYLIAVSNEEISTYYQLSSQLLSFEIKLGLLLLLGIIFWLEAHFFGRKAQQISAQIKTLKEQLSFTLKSKKRQQQKANTYSDHTEKLKSFISDKLLEYIEYDEKFIHFKGIASEVRHNGVISYDKVITALKQAIEQQRFLAIYEQSDENDSGPSEQTINSLSNYQNAIDAMRYLWDLLDLSTADNMAMHIGNQLIECEEHYYQLHLDTDKKMDITQSIPVSPTFFPQVAALMSISMMSDEVEIRTLLSLARINNSVLNETFQFENEQFRVQLFDTPELLGNPNHIILLLENLIKNAQFFSHKANFKQKTDRIALTLIPGNGFALFSVYNRGPHISEEEKENIFKLGFSTRRKKEHHGKGLGLFFSQQIVTGYQGNIRVNNVYTPELQYTLKVELASGESQHYVINTQMQSQKPLAKLAGNEQWDKEVTIISDIPIVSLEISTNEEDSLPLQQILNEYEPLEWLEPTENFQPKWLIQLNAFKKTHKLSFKPLDINGVQFEIKIPTADSRLNEQELDFENEGDIDSNLDKMAESYNIIN
ncbi:sensor histidine kinase [Aliikangiella sp. IMCC44359]|uniref:sensor histidine kinase n=1 Tax=Aliikangiella sp. IMCC44359 TaxID=3459125 RepID=UPI00403B3649